LYGLIPNGGESSLFDAFACFLVKDNNQVAGTLYVREADVIFFANVFGVDIRVKSHLNYRFIIAFKK
jgi:hypothetical protein